jgi:protein-L-isoaspartate(D-aspartate) O-methyltransferase
MRKRLVPALVAVVLVGAVAAGAAWRARRDILPEPSPSEVESEAYALARARMVEEGVVGWGITDPEVIAAMGAVPRHLFVPTEYLAQAYENHPLPIGLGQTISQPYIVALMTEALELESGEKVLEIGTGSGYQAAVLAEMGVEVYSVEILLPLAESAAERLGQAGYDEVHTRAGDGYFGWPEEAPFDAIIVTAAPDHVPQPLLTQLAVGGLMVIPIGPPGGYQELWLLQRDSEDQVVSTNLGGVRFVPLVRDADAPDG